MRIGPLGRVLATGIVIAAIQFFPPSKACAETTLVAVAANFVDALKELANGFEAETGHTVKYSSGSTGHLYAQIKHGAPFDVFLAADEERPRMLESEGEAVAGSGFTYAVGQLMCLIPNRRVPEGTLPTPIAIANPDLAPYGRAAWQVLQKSADWEKNKANIVFGQNVAQVYAMLATGNAKSGFVARSQLKNGGSAEDGLVIPVDPKLHDPIRQDAVLLKSAESKPAAKAFMNYLKSPNARTIIARFGYLDGDN